MNRRGFLGAILAAGAAPWVVKAGVLMPVHTIVTPPADVLTVDHLRRMARALRRNAVRPKDGRYYMVMGAGVSAPGLQPRNPADRIVVCQWLPYEAATG